MGQCFSQPGDQGAALAAPLSSSGAAKAAAPISVTDKLRRGGIPTTFTPGMEEEEVIDLDKEPAPPNAVTNPDTDLILNMLDPVNGPACGLPYQVHWLGPPRPPGESERLATVHALNKIKSDAAPDPEIATILKLVASVFKCPAALCALFDEQRVFISEQEGNVIPCGEFPWRWTLCGWSMAFKNPQVLVIQDTLQDARFSNNEKVTVFPKVRFYCGAPLVASNGHRLGTLCFADVKPRKFDMASCVLMNNLSELVVRQLEKDIALKIKEKANQELLATYHHLQRAVDAYEHCVVLLDTSEPGWRVVYSNSSWSRATGLPREGLVGRLLSEVLESTDGTQLPSPALLKAASALKSHRIATARVKDPSVTKTFALAFKPAGKNMMDGSTVPIGVPSFLPVESPEEDVAHRYYFLGLYPPGTQLSNTTQSASCSLLSPAGMDLSGSESGSELSVLPGLELAHLLGRGSWGWVYYGTWYGTPVAVKVIDEDPRSGGRKSAAFDSGRLNTGHSAISAGRTSSASVGGHGMNGVPHREALMAQELRHPYIVATLAHTTRQVPCGRAPELLDYRAGVPGTCAYVGDGSAVLTCSDSALKAHTTTAQSVVVDNQDGRTWAVIEAPTGLESEDGTMLEGEDAETLRACQVRPDGWGLHDSSVGCALSTTKAGLMTGEHASDGGATSGIHTGAVRNSVETTTMSAMLQQTWMVMEFCDRGCVQDAVDRGWLRTEPDCLTSKPNMKAILATALEIASAMAYLHDHDIVHGDLSGWNVMLCSVGATSGTGGRGFVAKVADFGMAKACDTGPVMTRNYGTITHMPPELLRGGVMSKATDVWSFSVLLWQMYTGSRPWSGLTHAQVIMKVCEEKAALQWDRDVPADYLQLAKECMAWDMNARPAFTDIVKRLDAMGAKYEMATL